MAGIALLIFTFSKVIDFFLYFIIPLAYFSEYLKLLVGSGLIVACYYVLVRRSIFRYYKKFVRESETSSQYVSDYTISMQNVLRHSDGYFLFMEYVYYKCLYHNNLLRILYMICVHIMSYILIDI